jgi:hypothetical protein
MNSPFPVVPLDLLQELEKRFPERTPDLHLSIDEIRHRGGETSVVRFLRRKYEEQEENVLSMKVLYDVPPED